MANLKTHNVMDYIIAVALISIPFLFGFSEIESARNVFLILGFGLAAYSLITKYYYSVAKIIPLGLHMVFDVGAGLVVIAAPYIFDYRDNLTALQFVVHVVMGLGALALVSLTSPRTESAKTIEQRRETSGHSYDHKHVGHA